MGVEAHDLVRDNFWASHLNHATWIRDDGRLIMHAGY